MMMVHKQPPPPQKEHDTSRRTPPNPIQDLLQRILSSSNATTTATVTTAPPPSYVVLLQHASSVASLRAAASGRRDDVGDIVVDAVYNNGRVVRTRAENAQRDLVAHSLLFEYMFRQIVQWCSRRRRSISSTTDSSRSNYEIVVVLQTKPKSTVTYDADNKKDIDSSCVHTIDLSQDPFGWDQDEQKESGLYNDNNNTTTSSTFHLDQLDRLVERMQELGGGRSSSTTPLAAVLVDSLTPLWTRHGAIKTRKFLQTIAQCVAPKLLILPVDTAIVHSHSVLSSSSTLQQHLFLQDLASAIFLIDQGEVTILRRGVRQGDNFVRQTVSYDIVQEQQQYKGRTKNIIRIKTTTADDEPVLLTHHDVVDKDSAAATKTTATTTGRKPRVELALNENARPVSSTPQNAPDQDTQKTAGPRNFLLVQDNDDHDPELDDYYDDLEEDPDDDLDI